MQETPLSRDTVDHTNPVSYSEGIGTECAIIALVNWSVQMYEACGMVHGTWYMCATWFIVGGGLQLWYISCTSLAF